MEFRKKDAVRGRIDRRAFLRLTMLTGGAAILAACGGGAAPAAPEPTRPGCDRPLRADSSAGCCRANRRASGRCPSRARHNRAIRRADHDHLVQSLHHQDHPGGVAAGYG